MTTTKLLNQASTKLDSAERCLNTGHLDVAIGWVTDSAIALGRAGQMANNAERFEVDRAESRLRGIETLVRHAVAARITNN